MGSELLLKPLTALTILRNLSKQSHQNIATQWMNNAVVKVIFKMTRVLLSFKIDS